MSKPQSEPVEIAKVRELRIPRPGGAVSQTIGYSFVSLFVILAVFNLQQFDGVPTTSIIASLLWLFFVGFVIVANVREEGGLGQYLVNRMGCYSKFHFVRATPSSGKAEHIIVGFTMFGRVFAYGDVNVNALFSLNWGPGQASCMRNDVCDDWTVDLWFDRSGDDKSELLSGRPDARIPNLLIIGPCFSKTNAEVFFNELLLFLTGVGVELMPGKDRREFITTRRAHARFADDNYERTPHPTP